MWLRSDLLTSIGFPQHGFTMKDGGVSQGDFASWNFSTSTGDSIENVQENYRLLAKRLDIDFSRIFTIEQVHSNRVIEVTQYEQITRTEQADALISSLDAVVVGVKTADCVPILMADPISRTIAAIHAGWKGVVAKIVTHSFNRLKELHPNAEPYFAIGPHILYEHFQVGSEVAELFPLHHQTDSSSPDRYLVDLQGAISSELTNLGVPLNHIDFLNACTLSDEQNRFFSHRRTKGKCGRLFNFISNSK